MTRDKKMEVMDSVLVKLKDAENSTQSLIEKFGVIQVELFQIDSRELDQRIDAVMKNLVLSLNTISDASQEFKTKKAEL